MFKKLKLKIKIAKIIGIIIATLFVIMLINNIYLNYKIISIENSIKKQKTEK